MAQDEHRFYDTRRWRGEIRPAKLERNPLCEDCEVLNLVVVATDVDHIDGDTSNNADENLRSLCHPCHSSKTASHDGGFGRGSRLNSSNAIRIREGCDAQGLPIDPRHHWNKRGGG